MQGYKFNIFYPDLIDKLEAPTYLLEKDPGADEHGSTCMLRWARLYIASFMRCFTFSINCRGQTGAPGVCVIMTAASLRHLTDSDLLAGHQCWLVPCSSGVEHRQMPSTS